MRGDRGVPISQDHPNSYDFERLERAVAALAAGHESLQSENDLLRRQLKDRDGRLRDLDERVLELHQRRQDALKRMDELISQFELLAGACGGGGE